MIRLPFTSYSELQLVRRRRPPPFDPSQYINAYAAAQEYVAEYMPTSTGVDCPICGQPCKLYPEPLSRHVTLPLVWLCRTFRESERWVHMIREAPPMLVSTRKYGLLHWWGLATSEVTEEDADKKNSGRWRPTQLGFDFVERLVRMPRYVFLFDDTYYGCAQDQLVAIDETLDDRFSWAELRTLSAESFGVRVTEILRTDRRRVSEEAPQPEPIDSEES